MSATQQLARFAAETTPADIPPEVMARALALISDLVGSGVRAAQEADSTPSVLAMLSRLGMEGSGPCTVFGLNRRYGPAAAARAAGTTGALGCSELSACVSSKSSEWPSVPFRSAAAAGP